VVKPDEQRPLVRPRTRWEDNIKTNHKEVGRGSMDWTDIAEDRDRCGAFVNAVMHLRFP
jgi:hypothetical protein